MTKLHKRKKKLFEYSSIKIKECVLSRSPFEHSIMAIVSSRDVTPGAGFPSVPVYGKGESPNGQVSSEEKKKTGKKMKGVTLARHRIMNKTEIPK